jgi:GH24 family phage-related lysozyme (muramidase)
MTASAVTGGSTGANDSDTTSAHNLDNSGLDFISNFEGYRSTIYNDSAGLPTIGFGHLIREAESSQFAGGVTREQAVDLLNTDSALAVTAVNDLVEVPLNQNQFNALTSFVYNVGRGNFESSTLRREVNLGRFDRVSDELNRWTHAGGREISGLQRRRAAEGELFNRPLD